MEGERKEEEVRRKRKEEGREEAKKKEEEGEEGGGERDTGESEQKEERGTETCSSPEKFPLLGVCCPKDLKSQLYTQTQTKSFPVE